VWADFQKLGMAHPLKAILDMLACDTIQRR